ncbi:hypothetical protein E2C01_100355 [Portunus trituberculatus]|uniref:Uncharacterized protein n=1 Tax=Portunus trituberculatus TaxID=210409 RepID=A0A5B7KDD9_PORTR|nr:hypothetical protein [Portunus trituberculatus]
MRKSTRQVGWAGRLSALPPRHLARGFLSLHGHHTVPLRLTTGPAFVLRPGLFSASGLPRGGGYMGRNYTSTNPSDCISSSSNSVSS